MLVQITVTWRASERNGNRFPFPLFLSLSLDPPFLQVSRVRTRGERKMDSGHMSEQEFSPERKRERGRK